MTSIAEIGEFGLIARLTAGFAVRADVLEGVGDDAAVVTLPDSEALVATCDAQVEGTHFRLDRAEPFTIGRRALAVNLSDIAAMGAIPRFALVSLLAPPTLAVTVLDGIYAGLRAEAGRFGVAIIGGNVARNPERLILDITLLGSGTPDRLLRRSGGRPGDAICVTGQLGTAAAGLALLDDPRLGAELASEFVAMAVAAQQTPTPRVSVGQWLAAHGATAALDISDGLAADLHHLCAASGVGATIDAAALPIAPATVAIASEAGSDATQLALFGGDDYELLFTTPAATVADMLQQLPRDTGVSATQIGTLAAGNKVHLLTSTAEMDLPSRGWDHMIERTS